MKAKEIGSEATPEEFIETMVRVFREVRRVLRPDGTLWLNLGETMGDGQLLNIPHRVAEALRQDGWIWRQTIIFAKKSPMPESVKGVRYERCRVKVGDIEYRRSEAVDAIPSGWNTKHEKADTVGNFNEDQKRTRWQPCPGCSKCRDTGGWVLRRGKGRCTVAHEYIFLMVKNGSYFWDSVASAEKAICADSGRQSKVQGDFDGKGTDPNMKGRKPFRAITQTRNMRSVWSLSSEPHSLKHFASFPSELVKRCLSAGVSAAGVCPHCGAPWAPMIDTERLPTRPATNKIWKHADGDKIGQRSDSMPNLDPERHIAVTNCVGYRPTCECPEHEPVGSLILDPFAGICTVGQTAIKLGNRFIGVDLNEKYLEIAAKRIFEPPRWWLRQQDNKLTVKPLDGQMELFH